MKRLITVLALAAASFAAQAQMAEGEVRKVDKEAAKITLRHGEIKNLDMPPMTMVFQVKDAKMLDGVKVGDKVRFAAEKLPAGYTVTSLETAK
jgi:Cu/Ag efflux protein CusF